MELPPLTDRALPVLVKEVENLARYRREIDASARALNMTAVFAEPLARLDEASDAIRTEIAKRGK